ncbi:protein HESO1 [Eutrema salsugineum]|uniref:protein HESO1 n=1 Tax=Eutrema salsugineum TaxID=72664 RepID=UPI000CED0DDA|nr:protein HESO1 [Eutrema salsugineum]
MDSRSSVSKENTKSSKVIRKKVKNSESVALQRYKIDSYDFLELDKLLDDVYCSVRPVTANYDTRKDMVKFLNAIAFDIYGEYVDSIPVLEAYGSFVMDTFSSQSDLDVSINFGNETSEISREKKLQILERFAEKLRSLQEQGRIRSVQAIWTATVPILRFVDEEIAVECDLSVDSKDGILSSQIIEIISRIDDRFQKLCLLIKHWAKAHEVNDTSQQTLNSLSITLLVAHHLQTQDPPILPPFSLLFKDGVDPLNVEKRSHSFLNWGQQNKESLSRLFVTFFVKLQSVEFLWGKELCVSLLNGLWISKTITGSIKVLDIIDVSNNVARCVTGKGAKKVYRCINKTVEELFEFLDGKINATHLRDNLFTHQAFVEPPEEEDHHDKRVCSEKNGHLVQHRRHDGGFGGAKAMHDHGEIDLPPPPPPYGRVYRVYCERFGPQNLPEPQ